MFVFRLVDWKIYDIIHVRMSDEARRWFAEKLSTAKPHPASLLVENIRILMRRLSDNNIAFNTDPLILSNLGIEEKETVRKARLDRVSQVTSAASCMFLDFILGQRNGWRALLGLAFGDGVSEGDLKGIVNLAYTPAVAGANWRFHIAEKVLDRYCPAINPLSIKYDPVKVEQLRTGEEDRAILAIQAQIREKAKQILAHNTGRHVAEVSDSEVNENLETTLVVLTDGGRILGIGDQGANGRKICSGKLLADFIASKGAITGKSILPIGVDVGTDRKELQESEHYKGLKHPRIRGQNYRDYMHLVLKALNGLKVPLVQFEDIQGEEATDLLDWVRRPENKIDHTIIFNDDIEGTASMLLSAFLYAKEKEGIDLSKSLFVIPGAGGAAFGVKRLLSSLLRENYGISPEEINQRFIFTDTKGVLYEGRRQKSGEEFKPYQKNEGMIISGERLRLLRQNRTLRKKIDNGKEIKLEEVLAVLNKSQGFKNAMAQGNGSVFLVGLTTEPATISERTIKLCASIAAAVNHKLGLWGLSNPTEKTDFITRKESNQYYAARSTEEKNYILYSSVDRILKVIEHGGLSADKVMWATGSPFPSALPQEQNLSDYSSKLSRRQYTRLIAIKDKYKDKWPIIAQGNNFLIFPAVTLGIYIAKKICLNHGIDFGSLPKKQSDWETLWLIVSKSLHDWYQVNETALYEKGAVLPPADKLVELTEHIAFGVTDYLLRQTPSQAFTSCLQRSNTLMSLRSEFNYFIGQGRRDNGFSHLTDLVDLLATARSQVEDYLRTEADMLSCNPIKY